jgi:hypothetical protein
MGVKGKKGCEVAGGKNHKKHRNREKVQWERRTFDSFNLEHLASASLRVVVSLEGKTTTTTPTCKDK